MAATLELRRFVPQNFSANNPNPDFSSRDGKNDVSNWSINTSDFDVSYNWKVHRPHVNYDSGTTPTKLATTEFSPTFRSVVVCFSADEGTSAVNLDIVDESDDSTLVNTTGNHGTASLYQFRVKTNSEAAFSGNVSIRKTEDNTNVKIFGVYFFEEDITTDNIFQSTTNNFTVHANNLNLLSNSWSDQTDSDYNTDSEEIKFADCSKYCVMRPVFTGNFNQVYAPQWWIDSSDYSQTDLDGNGTSDNVPNSTGFNQTDNTRLGFFHSWKDDVMDGESTNQGFPLVSGFDLFKDVLGDTPSNSSNVTDIDFSVSTTTGTASSESNRFHFNVPAEGSKLDDTNAFGLLDSTVSGENAAATGWQEVIPYYDSTSDTESIGENKLELKQKGNFISESEEADYIDGNFSYPDNALDPMVFWVSTKETGTTEVDTVTMNHNFEWQETS